VLEAAVVLAQGYEPSESLTAELQSYVKTRFAAHAYPRRVHYLADLPKTPSGKIQRFLIRQRLKNPSGRGACLMLRRSDEGAIRDSECGSHLCQQLRRGQRLAHSSRSHCNRFNTEPHLIRPPTSAFRGEIYAV
jgi:hypothetical protein